MSDRNKSAAHGRWRRRLRLWYAYDLDADDDDDANGMLIIAVTEAQVRSIWRHALGLTVADAEAESISVKPAVWEQNETEPKHPRKAGVWWPRADIFRGYGFHFDTDHCCVQCSEYVEEVDDDGYCRACAVPRLTPEKRRLAKAKLRELVERAKARAKEAQ